MQTSAAKWVLLGLILLAACADTARLHLNSSYDDRVDFSQIKSFHWGESSLERLYRNNVSSNDMDLRVKQSISRQLAEHGLREASSREAGDTVVSYQLSSRAQPTTERPNAADGILVITFYDAAGQRSIWRGMAQAKLTDEELSDSNTGKVLELIDLAIAEILKTFPPQE